MEHEPQPAANENRLTITVPEAGELLGLGRAAAYEAARSGQLPVLRIGHRLLVPIAQLEKLVGAPAGTLSRMSDPLKKRPCDDSEDG